MKSVLGHNSNNKSLFDLIIKDPETGKSTGRIKLNDTVIKNYLSYDHSKDVTEKDRDKGTIIINDSEKIGLKCRVRKSGTKTWYYEYTPKGSGRTERHTIGNFPEFNTKKAREVVEELKTAIKIGKNPRKIIAELNNSDTLGNVAAEFYQNRVAKSPKYKDKKGIRNRLKVWLYLKPSKSKFANKETLKFITKNFNALNIQKKNIKIINKDDLISHHSKISEKSLAQANRVIDDIQQVFNYAVEKGLINHNPCRFKKEERNTIDSRMTKVEPYTKQQWWTIVKSTLFFMKNEKSSTPAAGSLLGRALTGRRKMEVQKLQWKQIREKEIVFASSDLKNDKPLHVPLLPMASQLFNRMENFKKSYRDDNEKKLPEYRQKFVFPSLRKTSKKPYVVGVSKTWKKIILHASRKDSTIEYKCPHMLRHTFACMLLEATGNIKLVKDIMGWSDLKIVEVYTKYLGKKAAAQGIEKLNNFLHVA